ncbi:hypothetical protein [uncultured Senegalimassilia sp.]|nr:hypothetical protein [uncultured Senegalimassilia sp.]
MKLSCAGFPGESAGAAIASVSPGVFAGAAIALALIGHGAAAALRRGC